MLPARTSPLIDRHLSPDLAHLDQREGQESAHRHNVSELVVIVAEQETAGGGPYSRAALDDHF